MLKMDYMNEWISVKDKLPIEFEREGIISPHKLSMDVLTYNGFKEMEVGLYDYDSKVWAFEWGEVTDDLDDMFNVTHWMYLPPPPLSKAEKN